MLFNMGIGITAEYTAMGDLFTIILDTTRVCSAVVLPCCYQDLSVTVILQLLMCYLIDKLVPCQKFALCNSFCLLQTI